MNAAGCVAAPSLAAVAIAVEDIAVVVGVDIVYIASNEPSKAIQRASRHD